MGLLVRFQGHILDFIVFQMENTGRQKNIVEEISLTQLSIPERKTLVHLHKGGEGIQAFLTIVLNVLIKEKGHCH